MTPTRASISEALIWTSTAPRHLVDYYPSERAKAVGLGGVIWTTAAMAALSLTFALHDALHVPFLLAALGGLVWGAAVFNVDRWLVSALKRRPTIWGNIGTAAPRLLLSGVLGFVIAEPLVLRTFDSEVDAELVIMQREDAAQHERDLVEDPRYADLDAKVQRAAELQNVVDGGVDTAAVLRDPEVVDLQARLDAKAQPLADAEQAVICEHEGTCGSNRVGAGPAYREKVALRDRLRAEVADLEGQLTTAKDAAAARLASTSSARRASATTELAALQKDIDATTASRNSDSNSFDAVNARDDGLLARMEALSHLGARSFHLNLAQWLLRIVFVLIDCLPVLIKLMLMLAPPTAMERAMQREEDDADLLHEADLTDRQATIRLETEPERLRQQAQATLSAQSAQSMARKIVEAEERMHDVLIAEWERRQMDLIQNDIDSYIS